MANNGRTFVVCNWIELFVRGRGPMFSIHATKPCSIEIKALVEAYSEKGNQKSKS